MYNIFANTVIARIREYKKPLIALLIILVLGVTIFLYFQLSTKKEIPVQKSIQVSKEYKRMNPELSYDPKTAIISYKEGKSPQFLSASQATILNGKLKKAGVTSQKKISQSTQGPLSNYYELTLQKGVNVEDVITLVEAIGEVESVEKNSTSYELQVRPNDEYFNSTEGQWGLFASDMEQAWDIGQGYGADVAVFDSGVDATHEDLIGKVLPGFNTYSTNTDTTDPLGHGTMMAGIIAALTDNTTGIAGMGWKVSIRPIKVGLDDPLDPDQYSISTIAVVRGIDRAVRYGAKVISMGYAVALPISCEEFSMNEGKILQDAINYAIREGVFITAPAGNDDIDASNVVPSCMHGVVSVGGVGAEQGYDPGIPYWQQQDLHKKRWEYSNWGPRVDIAAPAFFVNTTVSLPYRDRKFPGSPPYKFISGTSPATAFVSAAAVLLMSVNPSLTPDEVKHCLTDTTDFAESEPGKPVGKQLYVLRALQGCKDHVGSKIAPTPPDIIKSNPDCTGNLSYICGPEEPNNKLKAEWDIKDQFGGCNAFIVDKIGTHVISNDCKGSWESTTIPYLDGSSQPVDNVGIYRLIVSNGGTCINEYKGTTILSCGVNPNPPSNLQAICAPTNSAQDPLGLQLLWDPSLTTKTYRVSVYNRDTGAILFDANVLGGTRQVVSLTIGNAKPGTKYGWNVTSIGSDGKNSNRVDGPQIQCPAALQETQSGLGLGSIIILPPNPQRLSERP